MSDLFHSYEPRQGHRLPHDPLNMIVAPRPIGWISTRSASGALNLAPYSFFNAFNYKPPIIGFSSIGHKDSVRNVEQTREFAWNLVTLPLAEAMNQTSAPLLPEASEFDFAGLTPLKLKTDFCSTGSGEPGQLRMPVQSDHPIDHCRWRPDSHLACPR